MSWLKRARGAILGMSSGETSPVGTTSTEAGTSPPVLWDGLEAVQAAINEKLTGSPERHPAAQACLDHGAITRCLVLGDTESETVCIESALAAQSIAADATVLLPAGGRVDRSLLDGSVGAALANATHFDAALVSLSLANLRDPVALFSWLHDNLAEDALLWLHLRDLDGVGLPDPTRLMDAFLQQVPSRWRLKARYEGAPAVAQIGTPSSRACESALRAYFDVTSTASRGGTLLAPLFSTGCISPEMDSDLEGRALLRALYLLEAQLVERGEMLSREAIYVARPRGARAETIESLFEAYAGPLPEASKTGMSGPLPQWIDFNIFAALHSARATDWVAPFPPETLMYHTTGLVQPAGFAGHGADILTAFAAASPRALNSFESVLDFGVGVGRVGRYFKGFSGRYVGVDIDSANIAWVSESLPWIEAIHTKPAEPLPFEAATFDCVISVSVFTHIDRQSTEFYIDELHRVTRPGALLFLTLHGLCALELGISDETVASLMGVAPDRLLQAKATLAEVGFDFAEQYTHLTQEHYRYGTTFVSQAELLFGRKFSVHAVIPGAIHDFQDLIVLERH